MKAVAFIFMAALLAALNAESAISISNVTAAQREGTKLVDIFFDASNTAGSSVGASVVVMYTNIAIDAAALTGDVGPSVPAGTGLHIVWDGGADLDGIVASNVSISLTVSPPVNSGMVLVPGGVNEVNDPDFSYTLSVDSFFIDATEITKDEWDGVDATAYNVYPSSVSGTSGYPVYNITWYEAAAWCNARSDQEGLTRCYYGNWSCNFNANGYRLPTEEEWEYAARGGESGWRYPWGNSITYSDANCKINGYYHPDYGFTSPVESFAPNGYGLFDVAGNVWEWCWDVNDSAGNRVLKGGSWNSRQNEVRCGHSGFAPPANQGNFIGFRTVRNASVASETVSITLDARDYELEVFSDHGSPLPMVGTNAFAWKAAVTCSVEAAVNEGGTNFTCTGWAGTGSVPMLGTSNRVIVVLNDPASSIAWNWLNDDSDFDGMNDDWENAFFGDLSQAGTNDFDFDGQSNFDEYIAGTIPTNRASIFKLDPELTPGQLILHWPAASNRTYNLYWTPNLIYIGFQPLETDIAFPRNSATSSIPAGTSPGFYRMDVSK